MTHETTIPESRAVDVAVAERVMGLKRLADLKGLPVFESADGGWLLTNALVQAGSFAMQYDPPSTLPHYSTDIGAAWRVLGALKASSIRVQYDSDYGIDHRSGWSVIVDGSVLSEFAESPPLAICKAALAWAESRKESAR